MTLAPPRAPRISKTLRAHHHQRVDPYFWMNNRDDERVRAHLESENQYTQSVMARFSALQEQVIQELKARIEPREQSVPVPFLDFAYGYRFDEGLEYPIHTRKPFAQDAAPKTILDVNQWAKESSYCRVTALKVAPNQRWLCFAIDRIGRRIYDLMIVDMGNGEVVDHIKQTTGNMVWASDATHLFFTRQDPETLRADRVYRHRLGQEASSQLVFEERDDQFGCHLYATKSMQHLVIYSSKTDTSHLHLLPATDPLGTWAEMTPLRHGHEYHVDHLDGPFYMRTNSRSKNFHLMSCEVHETHCDAWRVVEPPQQDVFLEDFDLFPGHRICTERIGGRIRIRVTPDDGPSFNLPLPDEVCHGYLGANRDPGSSTVRFVYSSLRTPRTVADYDLTDRQTTVRKTRWMPPSFDADHYSARAMKAPSASGQDIPISLVFKGHTLPRDAPVLIYGYGAYGITIDPSFDSHVISLLDRGFVYVIAHIRGGQFCGREWYEMGRQEYKENSFTDFIDVANHLLNRGIAAPQRLYARGGSAGGLLLGAVINKAPGLFRAVVAEVPFVDVVTTMLDASIPLTTSEYDEWGNPNIEEDYLRLLGYSPYDNIGNGPYPHMLVTAGLHDSQVQYWEPAKWVAKLRDIQHPDQCLLLHTDLSAGHSGTTGRYHALNDEARALTFLLAMDQNCDERAP